MYYIYLYTAWCNEIGSLASRDAPEFHASGDVREPISLHQAVHYGYKLWVRSMSEWVRLNINTYQSCTMNLLSKRCCLYFVPMATELWEHVLLLHFSDGRAHRCTVWPSHDSWCCWQSCHTQNRALRGPELQFDVRRKRHRRAWPSKYQPCCWWVNAANHTTRVNINGVMSFDCVDPSFVYSFVKWNWSHDSALFKSHNHLVLHVPSA